jgi:NitT/TauT family transport system substrate-binding protein
MGLAGIGAGLLVGCGDDDDSDGQALPPTITPTAAGEPPPEVTSIRVPRTRSGCNAPFIYAEEFLREEGFAEVRNVFAEQAYLLIDEVAEGSIDIAYHFIPPLLHAVEHGVPIVMLGPAHTACAQVVAADYVADLADLRGRRLGIAPLSVPQPGDFAFATSLLQWIGISSLDDVELVPVVVADITTGLGSDFDAVFTYPPLSYSALESRSSSGPGSGQRHIIFDSSVDEPWSRQLCCALFARRQFVEDNPVATKRALRAVLRALDHGASDLGALAGAMLKKGWLAREDYANRALAELTFGAWRTHDLAASMRFYGLYLHEAGLIQSTPEQLIQKGTDLTLFNELKSELAYAPGGKDRQFSFYCDPATPPAALAAPAVGPQRKLT